MEIPAPIRQRLGTEELESAVNLGDEDIICFTPTRTLLYRGEGLISNDSVEIYEHNVERLDVSEARRKTKFQFVYVDGEKEFSIANSRVEPVLERLLAGVLKAADVIEGDESVEGVFRFSEMALVITENRLVKRVGTYLWEDDYEEFPYANVTDLEFEDGSVATSIVISVDGRPQRMKAPRGDAKLVRRTLTSALCEYYDVDSLAALRETIEETSAATEDESESSISSDLGLDDSISPLVAPDDEDEVDVEGQTLGTGNSTPSTSTSPEPSDDVQQPETGPSTTTAESAGSRGQPAEPAIDPEDIEGMKARLATLTKVAKRQNKLLEQQQQTINQLVEELQRQE